MAYLIRSLQWRVKLSKKLFQGFAANISQDIKPSSVRHTHDDAFNTKFTGLINNHFHCWDQNFATLYSKTLLRAPFLGQKGFKPVMKRNRDKTATEELGRSVTFISQFVVIVYSLLYRSPTFVEECFSNDCWKDNTKVITSSNIIIILYHYYQLSLCLSPQNQHKACIMFQMAKLAIHNWNSCTHIF